MAKLPTFEEMAQEVAQRALDECEYEGKTLREWIEIIKTQPANGTDCISRQAAIDDIWTVSPLARLDRKWVDRWLRQLPPIQPKRGKWIDIGGNEGWYARKYRCSECGDTMLGGANFCPNCGAKMEVTT